jgi:hypothetical protein
MAWVDSIRKQISAIKLYLNVFCIYKVCIYLLLVYTWCLHGIYHVNYF